MAWPYQKLKHFSYAFIKTVWYGTGIEKNNRMVESTGKNM